jgi:hypothetical protein
MDMIEAINKFYVSRLTSLVIVSLAYMFFLLSGAEFLLAIFCKDDIYGGFLLSLMGFLYLSDDDWKKQKPGIRQFLGNVAFILYGLLVLDVGVTVTNHLVRNWP